MVFLRVATVILSYARKDWPIIRYVGKRHFLRDVVFTLEGDDMVVCASLFCV